MEFLNKLKAKSCFEQAMSVHRQSLLFIVKLNEEKLKSALIFTFHLRSNTQIKNNFCHLLYIFKLLFVINVMLPMHFSLKIRIHESFLFVILSNQQ